MSIADKNSITELAQASHAGKLPFSELVAKLAQLQVESYQTDFRMASTTYYLAAGSTYTVPLTVPAAEISQHFDAPSLRTSVRGTQRGYLAYPQFVRLAMLAGCVGYTVWIAGRQVHYFGRKGEQHVEPFTVHSINLP